MRVAFEVVGVPEVCEGIENGIARMQIAVFNQMRAEMLKLRNYTVSEHMNGPTGPNTVSQRSGNLARSVVSQVEDDGTLIEGVVGVPEASTAEKYARILHDGGTTRAHIIQAKNAKALAFQMNGQTVFRRLVHHPGSNIPARPYLSSALRERADIIKRNLTEAMRG